MPHKKNKDKWQSKGYVLVKGTAGIIISGIFYNEKEQSLVIDTYKGTLHFRPLEENENPLDLKNFEA